MKTFLIIFLSVIVFISAACQQSQDQKSKSNTKTLLEQFNEIFSEGWKYYKDKDYKKYREILQQLMKIAPDHPSLLYRYASASALLYETEKSLNTLEQIINSGSTVVKSVESDSNFLSLFENKRFKELVQRSKLNFKPVNNSQVAYTIHERDLIPEGVAFDPVKGSLYISSIYRRKIVEITKNGEIKNFTNEKQDGLLAVIGMEVDEKRRHLWVCSAFHGDNDILDIKEEKDTRPAAYKYDLESGRLIKKYTVKDSSGHFLNDLTIHSNGDVFITDSFAGEVYYISKEKDSLELFSEPVKFVYTNGITISDDENYLFIADYTGIFRMDIRTRECSRLKHDKNVTLVSADGLAFYKNSLIVHQGTALGGVNQYFLNPAQDRVLSKRTIETFNPLFEFPTTGELAGDTYYYIANAQFARFNKDRSIFPKEKLSDVYILKAKVSGLD